MLATRLSKFKRMNNEVTNFCIISKKIFKLNLFIIFYKEYGSLLYEPSSIVIGSLLYSFQKCNDVNLLY